MDNREELLFSFVEKDLQSSPFIRFFTQEDKFKSDGNKSQTLDLPFNQIINQAVAQLQIMTKRVFENSKMTTSFIENGRDISYKKSDYFHGFLRQYQNIGHAFSNMKKNQPISQIFQYSLMSLSNLLLKLSINMAKISVILLHKIYTPPNLNIFISTVLFQKYIESTVFKSQINNRTLDEARHFLKQFPKITILKIAKKRNPFDHKLIEQARTLFKSEQHAIHDVNLIQLIQLYQEEQEQEQTVRSNKSIAFNLRNKFKISSPFSYQLYLIFQELILPRIIDYKPDVVLFIEDYDCDQISIYPQIRGMIINDITAKAQHKLLYFKEIGVTKKMLQLFNFKQTGQFTKTENIEINQQIIEIQTKINKQIMRCREIEIANSKSRINQTNMFKNLNDEQKGLLQIVKNIKKYLLDDLTYVSQALIQKFNFQSIVDAYRNYNFKSADFLNAFIIELQAQKLNIQKEKLTYQAQNFISSKIKKIKGLKEFQDNLEKFPFNTLNSDEYFYYFNIKMNKIESLIVRQNNLNCRVIIKKDDSFIFSYQPQHLVICLFQDDQLILFAKEYHSYYFQYFKPPKQSYISKVKNSTIVTNNKYLYKAFGEFPSDLEEHNGIYRIDIQIIDGNIENLSTRKWVLFRKKCKFYSLVKGGKINDPVELQIQFKKYGYAYWQQNGEQKGKKITNNIIIFGGGYNYKSHNQEKINKFLYIVQNDEELCKVGKTNNSLFNEAEYFKKKIIIYPFVYGFPLSYLPEETIVINTNGYHENLNHFKKIFLTKIKKGMNPISSRQIQIGIISQGRIQMNTNQQEIISNKNALLSYLINSYNKINRFQQTQVLYDMENNMYLIKIIQKNSQNISQKVDSIIVTPINHSAEPFDINFKDFRQQLKGQIRPIPGKKV